MRFATMLILFFFGSTLTATGFADQDPLEKAIKARQGEMQLRAFNAGPLFGMAKGQVEYDAELASKLAANLKLLLDLDNGRAWAGGTHIEAYPGKTTALKKIWDTYPEIADYGKNYAKAVNALAAVAGNGQDALKSEIGNLGKACKACHDDFREKN